MANTLLKTGITTGNTVEAWEYSVNSGNTWLALAAPINSVGSYIRYTATPTLPSGSILKTTLYI